MEVRSKAAGLLVKVGFRFAMVVAIVITLAGLVALIAGLPIAQYPQITLPSVRTSGA